MKKPIKVPKIKKEMLEGMIAVAEEEEKKEKEAFEKASSKEKIEKLRKYIDELGQSVDRYIEYNEERVGELEQKYNKLLSYIQRTSEEEDYRIVDRKTMLCKAKIGEVHNAILFFHGDGTTTVKCSAEGCFCKYGSQEL